MNQFIDNFLRGTLWIWLPFYALFALLREAGEKWRRK
jgi:hypothetical protein